MDESVRRDSRQEKGSRQHSLLRWARSRLMDKIRSENTKILKSQIANRVKRTPTSLQTPLASIHPNYFFKQPNSKLTTILGGGFLSLRSTVHVTVKVTLCHSGGLIAL
jgi:hypothetical protein